MPLRDPDTAAAVTATPAPPEPSVARIPSPAVPVTVPLTVMETVPPPVFRAMIPLFAPFTSWPVADWTNVIPAEPGCVRMNASAPVSTGVSEFSVTCSGLASAAFRTWAAPIWKAPLQTNTPVPLRGGTSRHSLVKTRTRSNLLFVGSNRSS